MRHLNGLRWHDIQTEFHDDQFGHLSNIMVITATVREDVTLVLLFKGIYEVRLFGGFMWHDIHTKFHEDWCRSSSNIKVLSQIWGVVMLVLLMGGIYELRR
jgi:hypothetical protein